MQEYWTILDINTASIPMDLLTLDEKLQKDYLIKDLIAANNKLYIKDDILYANDRELIKAAKIIEGIK
jgi:hypothetical protein